MSEDGKSSKNRVNPLPAAITARKGFTLVEMLTVLAIVIIIIAIAGPTVATVVRGPLLTQASDQIVGLLNLAQQTAAARNQPVVVRFYQYADPSISGESIANPDTGKFRAMQLFLADENGGVAPLNAVMTFPVGIIADKAPPNSTPQSGTLSTLLISSRQNKWTVDPQITLPRVGMTYNCYQFRFRPDGSTDLPPITSSSDPTIPALANKWFITVHDNRDGDARTTPPSNFSTIQIDPINGAIAVYRP